MRGEKSGQFDLQSTPRLPARNPEVSNDRKPHRLIGIYSTAAIAASKASCVPALMERRICLLLLHIVSTGFKSGLQ